MEPKGAKWIGLAAALGGAIRERKVTARGEEFRFFFLFFWTRKKAGSLGKTWVFKFKVVCDL